MRDLSSLQQFLNERVIDQPEASAVVTNAIKSAELELNDRGPRPRASFLFMGPTGVGKTSTAKAFTEYLFEEDRLMMIFMNELKSATDVPRFARMIQAGAFLYPDGCTFLLDEVEKAHKDVMDVLISLLDEGQITLEDGARVPIANCYVAMTSNVGSGEFAKMLITKYVRMLKEAKKQARDAFRPELMARINNVVVFRSLKYDSQAKILDLNLGRKLNFVGKRFGKEFSVDASARAHLIRRCFTEQEGARKLKDTLDSEINFAIIPWSERNEATNGRISYDPKQDKLRL
jgi:ATP-dependent Clp protease ATP-binding subunit ClpC